MQSKKQAELGPVKKCETAPERMEISDDVKELKGRMVQTHKEELGNATNKKKEFKKAINHCIQAIELEDTYISFITNLAPIRLEMGKFGVTRVHMEKDTGKLLHSRAGSYSQVDLNRAGVPLPEIVSEPDMRTGLGAAEYASVIQRLVHFLGASNGNMQEGSLRCDVNVYVRPVAQSEFGTKVEIKSLNSFSAMHRAIDHEISRQVLLHSEGQADQIVQETRLWEGAQRRGTMRKKEGLADYRYFPEPDLPQVVLTTEYVDTIHESLPELPESKRWRYEKMGLSI
ncbi:hypothetical protein ACHQM5_012947 [Ranunculus cassubicifolius]